MAWLGMFLLFCIAFIPMVFVSTPEKQAIKGNVGVSILLMFVITFPCIIGIMDLSGVQV